VRDPVENAVFSLVNPKPVEKPKLVAWSSSAMALLDVDADAEVDTDEASLAQVLSGNVVLPGSQPAAHCYCGHQFGSFAG